MNTASARTRHKTARSLFLGGGFIGILSALWTGGCSHDWAGYDPRLGEASSGHGGAGSAGPGSTAASSASSTATASSSSGMGGASSSSGMGGASSSSGMGGASSSSSSSSSAASSSSVASSSSSSAASSSSSGSGGMGGGGPTHCGGMNVLVDDFSGNDPGEVWLSDQWGGASITETGGELLVALPSNSPSGSGGVFHTKRFYGLRQDEISVEVTDATNPSTTAQALFWVGYDDNNYIEMHQQSGNLHFVQAVSGSFSSLLTIPYDPVAHRHWRFREDGLNTYWETSSDGTSFTTQTQVATATLFSLDFLVVALGGRTDGGEVNPGEAHFDRLNGGGAPKGKWCPISSFTDDFNDGMQSIAWWRSWENDPGMMSEMSGELVLTLTPNSTSYASYVSSKSFDLTSSSIVLEVPSVQGPSIHGEAWILLDGPQGNEIRMDGELGNLNFYISVAGAKQQIGSTLYSPVMHRWWRIRETSNTLYWETSPDGKAWTIQEQRSPTPIPIDVLDIYLGGGTWMQEASPGDAHFDNLNLPPP